MFYLFPIQKHKGPNLTLRKIGQGHNLNKIGRTLVPDAAYQVSKSSAFRRRFFKIFTIYGHGGHLGHVTRSILTNFKSPHGDSIWNLASIGPVISEEKMLKECGQQTTEAYLSYKLTNEPLAQVS